MFSYWIMPLNVLNAMNFREYPITSLLTDVDDVQSSYHEMIAHLPLASHPNPKKVLVMGGGDGSIVREVLKHDTVEQVVLCDVDEVRSTYIQYQTTTYL